MQLFKLVLFIFVGFFIARATGIASLQDTGWYMFAVASLLAIGLYASTYGIELKEARQHLRIILSAVTVGVVLKAAIIGGSLALIFHDPFFLVLGITVAQIDPLSVAGLMKGKRLSAKAKTILASWAAFDDPITVILCLYAPVLVVGSADTGASTISYLWDAGLNLALAGGALVLWLLIRRQLKKARGWLATGLSGATYGLLAVSLLLAVWHFMMLGIALIGLFLRPASVGRYIDPVIKGALAAAAILLGVLLVGGVNIWAGVALGVAAYCAQIIVGLGLTLRLPTKDRWHIAFAQQNGVTAIILALLFEPVHPGTVAIVAPAIIVINSLHAVVNKGLDSYILRENARPA